MGCLIPAILLMIIAWLAFHITPENALVYSGGIIICCILLVVWRFFDDLDRKEK